MHCTDTRLDLDRFRRIRNQFLESSSRRKVTAAEISNVALSIGSGVCFLARYS